MLEFAQGVAERGTVDTEAIRKYSLMSAGASRELHTSAPF